MSSIIHCTKDPEHLTFPLPRSLQNYMVEVRRHLHMYPELSWKEENTVSYLKSQIKDLLKTYKGSYALKELKGGIVLDLNISPEFDRILMRADIDALPIQEETGLSYSSKIPGVMHACGHDMHAAMLLGALKHLVESKLIIKHNLRMVFQRAEEVPYHKSGGLSLVEEGVLKNVSKVYALHVISHNSSDTFGSRAGRTMANPASFTFKIRCMGGHVKCPHDGSNAIDVITDIHMHLRGFALRTLGPENISSFVPTQSISGNSCNIMPEYAEATYTFRNFLTAKERSKFFIKLKKRIETLCKTYPDTSLHSFEVTNAYPALVNDPENYRYVNKLLEKNGHQTMSLAPAFSGDDFAYYLEKVEGSYWTLGAMQEHSYGHHTSRFNPNEAVMIKGAAFWLLLAAND